MLAEGECGGRVAYSWGSKGAETGESEEVGVSLIGRSMSLGLGQVVQESGSEQGVPVLLGREALGAAVLFEGQRCGGRKGPQEGG